LTRAFDAAIVPGPSHPMRSITASFFVLVVSVLCEGAEKWSISTFAGTGVQGVGPESALATAARIDNPFGVVRGPDDAIWFCQYTGQLVSRITADGRLHPVAGSGRTGYDGDGGPALRATFNLPHEIRFDRSGNLYVADMRNHAIRRVDRRSGMIATFAGTGVSGYAGDGGPADQAQLNQPHSIQFGPDGSLYICDVGNHVIRRVDPRTGTISTFAGTGKPGVTPDGAPIAGTPLNGPRSIDFDAAGNLWLVTRGGNQVFKFDLGTGRIQHVAGTGEKGFTGDGGPAKLATFSGPKGIAVALNGDVYLADTENHCVRMIEAATGRVVRVAGTGEAGDGPDGEPLLCRLKRPHGVFVDRDGSVFIGDSETHRVRVLRRE
jgi:streptogramin lyase